MNTEKYQKWTEHNWEQELKREDARITAYYKELPHYLGLPHEEKLIFSKLNDYNILADELPIWENDFDDDFDFLDENFINEKTEFSFSTDLFYEIGLLATNINFFINESPISNADALRILYLYGNLMSLQLDIIQVADNSLPSLRTALFKRQISTINKIIGLLIDLESLPSINIEKLEEHIAGIYKIRDNIIDNRFEPPIIF